MLFYFNLSAKYRNTDINAYFSQLYIKESVINKLTMLRKILNILLGLLIGAGFLIITFKDKSYVEIFESLKDANIFWVIANGICLFITFFLRSYRWKILLENAGAKAKTVNVLYSVIMGYAVNSFTPKLGEIARCVGLKGSDNVKTSVSLGTVVTERIYDVLVLGMGIVFCFIVELDKLVALFTKVLENNGLINLDSSYKLALILAIALVAFVGLFFVIKKIKLFEKVKAFIYEIIDTVKKSFHIKKIRLFIVLTVAIWVILTIMNYCCLKALPATDNFSLYFATIVLFIAGIGWALPSPGGIGTTHFFVLQIFIAFNLNESSGLAFAVLSNGLTLVFTWIIGIVALSFSIGRKLLLSNAKK